MSRYFTEDHEWIDVDGDVGTVGITEYAQEQLGDIVFVEVPDEGKELSKEQYEDIQHRHGILAPQGWVKLPDTPK